MNDPNWNSPEITKLIASICGSLVSLKFLKGSWKELSLMFVGGSALSYYSSEEMAEWIGGGPQLLGLSGFFLGLFGMAIVAKFYEVIQSIDSTALGEDIRKWLSRKWGA